MDLQIIHNGRVVTTRQLSQKEEKARLAALVDAELFALWGRMNRFYKKDPTGQITASLWGLGPKPLLEERFSEERY